MRGVNILSYLYVTESGSTISIDGGYFIVTQKNGLLRKIPKETLESVALFGNISITTPCVKEFLKKGISVSYFSENGAYFGRLKSTKHNNIKRLKKQIYMSDEQDFSLKLSQKIIKAKINNQITVLRRYTKNNAINDDEIKNMKYSLSRIEYTKTSDELLGYEGSAAKSYFKGLSNIVNPNFQFQCRNRMPPKDPFNSMLSLGYTLLIYEIYGEIENKGLIPYCGFLHKDHENHPTLASDLCEEWRSVIVDSVVLSLVQGYEISKDCFIKDDETNGVFLTKNGMNIFLKKYEAKMRSETKYINNQTMSFRRCLWHQVNSLTKAIENSDIDFYNPIYIR